MTLLRNVKESSSLLLSSLLYFSPILRKDPVPSSYLGSTRKSQESSSHVCMRVAVMVLLCLLAKWVILFFFGFFFGAFFVSGILSWNEGTFCGD
jgi:hypothetical protein